MGYTDFPLVNHHLPHETYSLFMFFLGITHVQTHPHGGKSLFKSLSTMIYLIYTWGVTFKVPLDLDMQSGYRKT